MPYEKLNLTNGTKLTAEHLAHLETGIENAWKAAYPIGAVYISANSTSPASLFGGTWEQLKDRFLLAAGDTYAAGATGGEAVHTLTASEMPAHTHNALVGTTGTSGEQCVAITTSTNRSYATTTSVGSGAAHNNMPPYKVYYMWERVA